jgi:Protein of unknown function (DUF2924)
MARSSVNPTTPASLRPQLGRGKRSPDELRPEWRRLYNNDPPRISRDLLILGIAYRRQEMAHGGLGKATLRKHGTSCRSLKTYSMHSSASNLALSCDFARLNIRMFLRHLSMLRKSYATAVQSQHLAEVRCR